MYENVSYPISATREMFHTRFKTLRQGVVYHYLILWKKNLFTSLALTVDIPLYVSDAPPLPPLRPKS